MAARFYMMWRVSAWVALLANTVQLSRNGADADTMLFATAGLAGAFVTLVLLYVVESAAFDVEDDDSGTE